jgi:hypothetical protein
MPTKTSALVYEGARPRAATGTVVFVGHARLPQSLAPRDSSAVISVEVETDVVSGAIVSASVRGVMPVGTRLMEELLIGRNINDGPQVPTDELRRRYVCPSHKAMCTALANAYDAYQRYRQMGAISS